MVVVEGFQQQVEAPRYAYDSAALFPSMANDFPGELPSGKSSGGLGLKNENRNSVNLWFFLRDEATRTRTRDDSRSGDSTSISNSASTWDVSEALVQCRKIVYHMDYLEYFADAEEKLDVFNEVIVRFEEALLGTPRVAARMTLGFGDPGPATPPDEEDTNPEVELRTAIDLEDDDELEQVPGHVQDHLQQQVLLERFTYRPVQYKHVAALFVALFDACPHKMSYETFEKKYVDTTTFSEVALGGKRKGNSYSTTSGTSRSNR
eukprot:g2344.t1